jgi:hypothetical protein
MKILNSIKIMIVAISFGCAPAFADTVAHTPVDGNTVTNTRDTSTQTGWQNQNADTAAENAGTAGENAHTNAVNAHTDAVNAHTDAVNANTATQTNANH